MGISKSILENAEITEAFLVILDFGDDIESWDLHSSISFSI